MGLHEFGSGPQEPSAESARRAVADGSLTCMADEVPELFRPQPLGGIPSIAVGGRAPVGFE